MYGTHTGGHGLCVLSARGNVILPLTCGELENVRIAICIGLSYYLTEQSAFEQNKLKLKPPRRNISTAVMRNSISENNVLCNINGSAFETETVVDM